jgi:hypothetical protein
MDYLKKSLVIVVAWVSVFIFLATINGALASFFTVGPKRCQKCHVEETKVWGGQQSFQGTKKFMKIKMLKSF